MAISLIPPVPQQVRELARGGGWAFQAGSFPVTTYWVHVYFAPGKQWQAHLGWDSDSFELQCDQNFAYFTQRFGVVLRLLDAIS